MKWLFLITLTIILASCSSKNADHYSNGETEEEALFLLNQKEYGKAIWLIENKFSKNPQEPAIKFILAQAYLGRSGIEPLAFAQRVLNKQTSQKWNLFLKNCDGNTISSPKSTDLKCIVKRIFFVSPNTEQGDFRKALELMRAAYPDPANSPSWVNALVGALETVSLLKRTGNLYLYVLTDSSIKNMQFNESDIPWIKTQGIESLKEANNALARAKYSGNTISRILGGSKEVSLFEKISDGVRFSNSLGLARLLDFAQTKLSASEDIKYGGLIDELRRILEESETEN